MIEKAKHISQLHSFLLEDNNMRLKRAEKLIEFLNGAIVETVPSSPVFKKAFLDNVNHLFLIEGIYCTCDFVALYSGFAMFRSTGEEFEGGRNTKVVGVDDNMNVRMGI